MLTSPGAQEIYLLLLSLAGFVGCAVLARASWVSRRYLSLTAWNLGVVAWGWLSLGEIMWNVVGWSEWVTRMPRATVFRVFMVAAIWALVWAHARSR